MPTEQRRRHVARDTRTDKEGEVMDETSDGALIYLRPAGGGTEWEVPREFVQLLDGEPEVPGIRT